MGIVNQTPIVYQRITLIFLPGCSPDRLSQDTGYAYAILPEHLAEIGHNSLGDPTKK